MSTIECHSITVCGRVQGVGFRPFVFRQATLLGLSGEVYNESSGVRILVQGAQPQLVRFAAALRCKAPGQVEGVQVEVLGAGQIRGDDFHIAPSRPDAGIANVLLADQGICADCLADFHDPGNRRYHYPFTSCSACGPRYSIVRSLPWDRANTTWNDLSLCECCLAEFRDPSDRRFHAVAMSCPSCGPQLRCDSHTGEQALQSARTVLRDGGILAVKGLSGYQLMVDATDPSAIDRLKTRKRRSKPLALLAPDLAWVQQRACVNATEAASLTGPARPIVLLQSFDPLAQTVAPGVDMLGAMLPHSGLQLRLLDGVNGALVATSGNLSGEPLLIDETEAETALGEIADGFLHHNLALVQALDDSIVRCMSDRAVTIRLARGLAPLSLTVAGVDQTNPLLGCGAQQKVTVSLLAGNQLFTGPHIGDLGSPRSRLRYRQHKRDLPRFFQLPPVREVTDLNPDYGSSIEADYSAPMVPHHVAHGLSAWAEEQLPPPFLVLAWDGVGLGTDRSCWGGEFLCFDAAWKWTRVASLLPFPLVAPDRAARQPRRVARALKEPGDGPLCTSIGRLVDGMASLAGLRQVCEYEAQAAMEWEACAWRADSAVPMEFAITGAHGGQRWLDWRPILLPVGDNTLGIESRALGFHQALARAATRLSLKLGATRVLLSGGVFQNRLLIELLERNMSQAGIELHYNRQIPPNDAGISIGQCLGVALGVAENNKQGNKPCALPFPA